MLAAGANFVALPLPAETHPIYEEFPKFNTAVLFPDLSLNSDSEHCANLSAKVTTELPFIRGVQRHLLRWYGYEANLSTHCVR